MQGSLKIMRVLQLENMLSLYARLKKAEEAEL